MPAFHEAAGGPLTPEQIESLAGYLEHGFHGLPILPATTSRPRPRSRRFARAGTSALTDARPLQAARAEKIDFLFPTRHDRAMHARCRRVASRLRTAIGALLLLFTPGVLSGADLCDWQSRTPPDPLQGHQGNSATDTYWFSHLADVDQVGNRRQFIFGLRNLHPQNFLPVEWLRGDGQPQLSFTRLAPGKCGESAFETAYLSDEDRKARIQYGPVRQFKKEDAALYIKVEPAKDEPAKVGRPMRSRLTADLEGADGKPERLHLEFSAEAEGIQFVYSVVNRGSRSAQFRVPALASAWEKLAATRGFETVSKWVTEGNRFVAPAGGETSRQVIRISTATGCKEAQVPVEVLSPTGETVATGQVTVFLPELERR